MAFFLIITLAVCIFLLVSVGLKNAGMTRGGRSIVAFFGSILFAAFLAFPILILGSSSESGVPSGGGPYYDGDGYPYDDGGFSSYDPPVPGGGPYHDGSDGPFANDHLEVYPPEEVPGLAEYVDQCRRLDQGFEEANIVYKPFEQMSRSNAQTVEVAVTLRTQIPPQEILESAEAHGFRVRVTCVVEARLDGANSEFEIQETDWRPQSLLTSPTARWTWSVTPKNGGNHELILSIRPVVTLEDEPPIGALPRPVVEASTLVRRISVDVSVPPDQWIAERFDSATALVASTEGFVVSITALLAAVVGLRLEFRRRQRKRDPDAEVIPE